MKTYVAGPISGYPCGNAQAFSDAVIHLTKLGHDPVNPLEISPGNTSTTSGDERWKAFMKLDIRALIDCDAIYMLHGWQQSKGATLEHHIATELGLEIFYQDNYD
jgi:hypothetical protein